MKQDGASAGEERGPSLVPPVGRVLGECAALAGAWTLAEVLAAYASGGEFFERFWLFLGLYWLAGLTLAGAVLAIGERFLPRWTSLGSTAVELLPHLVLLAYALVIQNGSLMAGQGLVVRLGCGAVAIALGLWSLRVFRFRRGGWAVAILGAVLAGHFGTGFVQAMPGPVRGLCLVVLLFAPVLLIGAAHRRAEPGRRRPESVLLGSSVALAVVAVLVMRHHTPRDPRSYFVAGAQVPRDAAPGGPSQPNIVLIVLDTVRSANMSSYGYPHVTTPRIDRFAAGAVRYSNYTAVAAWTLPGHASLFTGLYPSRHGAHDPGLSGEVDTSGGRLADQFDTLAERLVRRGYATAGIVSNFGATSRIYNLDQGFRYYDALPSRNLLKFDYAPLLYGVRYRLPYPLLLHPLEKWFPTPYRTAPEITDEAETWLANLRPVGTPYFLFLNYMDAHSPFTPLQALSEGCSADPNRFPLGGLSPHADREILGGQRAIRTDEREHLTCLYDGRLTYLDQGVGRLLGFLEGQPDYDNTWVIVTSDHGELLGEHGRLYHGSSLDEEILRIPLIVRYPRGWPEGAGRVDDRPAQQIDLVPTVLEALGEPADASLDGVSLRRRREWMLAEAFTYPYHSRQFPDLYRKETKSITVGSLKYVETSKQEKELYDLTTDPREGRNLLAASPEVAARLSASLEAWKRGIEGGAPLPGKGPSQEQRERLKALGYVH